MAIYSLSMSNVSRGAGSSTLATLSYIMSTRVHDERLGQTFYGFGRRERVEATGTLLPDGAPAQWADAEVLFNALEMYETASNARCGKKIIIALPREWDFRTCETVVRRYVREQLCTRGYAAAYAIHTDAEGSNPHVHILVANRVITAKGEWGRKQKKAYVLDEAGERVPLIDKTTGEQKVDKRGRRQWKRVTVESHPLDEKQTLKDLREAWAEVANHYLAPEDHIDHRSLEDQGIERIPGIHLGYAACEMSKRGKHSDRVEITREIEKSNQHIETLRAQRSRIDHLIEEVKRTTGQAIERARRIVDAVLHDEWLYKISDYIDRLVSRGVRVSQSRQEWTYSTAEGEQWHESELGERFTFKSVDNLLHARGERLASLYDPQEYARAHENMRAVENGGLPDDAHNSLESLQNSARVHDIYKDAHEHMQTLKEASRIERISASIARPNAQRIHQRAQNPTPTRHIPQALKPPTQGRTR